MDKQTIKQLLTVKGFKIVEEKRLNNNTGDMLKFDNGAIVNCFDSGKYTIQGKNTEEIKSILVSGDNSTVINNKNVFVVYGHDIVSRTQLEAMLRRWDLEPLILDQLESSGKTIIEKLEEFMPQAQFGIVLATPDDEGYAKGHEENKKYRVRQNVVLEMGMLLSQLGRSKVAILLKNTEDMEKPSDINGLIYIPFTDNVEETKVGLAKELNKNGYIIDVSKL